MTRAAIYLRVSTDAQADKGFSLQEQRASLTAYCEAKSLTLIEVVEDAGISGTDTERAGIRRLEELIAARVVDVIVCAKIDRLSRLAWFGERFIASARSRGVETVFADQHFDASPIGDFTRGIMGHVAQLEHSQIVDRMLAGKLQKAHDRKVMPVGRAPFGYSRVSRAQSEAIPEYAGRDGELLIDEEEAAVVREIYARLLRGEGLAVICRWLQDHPLASGRGHWSFTRLKRLIKTETYAGVRVYNRTRWKKGVELGEKPRSEWVTMPCPALVSLADWEAAQEILRVTATPGRPSADFLLRGIVVCGVCRTKAGEAVRCCGYRRNHTPGKKTYGNRYYRCGSRSNIFADHCSAGHRAETLEAGALKAVRKALRPGNLSKLALARAKAELAAEGDVETEAANLQQQLRQLDREEHRVADLRLDGFSPQIVREKLETIGRRRDTLRRLLAAAEERLTRQRDLLEAAVQAEALAEAALAELDTAVAEGDLDRQRRVLARFLRVILRPERSPVFEVQIPAIRG